MAGDYTDLVWNFTTEYEKCMAIYTIWFWNNGNINKSGLVMIAIYINGHEIREITFKLYIQCKELTVNGMLCVQQRTCWLLDNMGKLVSHFGLEKYDNYFMIKMVLESMKYGLAMKCIF